MSRKSLSISASVLGAVLVALVALFIRNTGTTNAGEVQIKEEGVVSHSAQADDALAAVSQRVGFQVKLPPSVPKSLELKFVDSLLGPAGLPNSMNLGILSYGPRMAPPRGEWLYVSSRLECGSERPTVVRKESTWAFQARTFTTKLQNAPWVTGRLPPTEVTS